MVNKKAPFRSLREKDRNEDARKSTGLSKVSSEIIESILLCHALKIIGILLIWGMLFEKTSLWENNKNACIDRRNRYFIRNYLFFQLRFSSNLD